jgi:hypothetical protein
MGALSGITNTGSPGFIPIETSIAPVGNTIRPISASGSFFDSFLMPP